MRGPEGGLSIPERDLPKSPHRIEMAQGSYEDLLRYVGDFPGAFYGNDNSYSFVTRFQQKIVNHRGFPHLLLNLGEPASGKTTILYDIVHYLLRENGPIANDMKKHGYKVRIDVLPWGDPFFVIPDDVKKEFGIEGKDYHDSRELMDIKRKEIHVAEGIYENSLLHTVSRYFLNPEFKNGQTWDIKADEIFHIVIGDIPVISGGYYGQDMVGVPRALKTLEKLVHREGEFSGQEYSLTLAATVADPTVRGHNIDTRADMLNGKTIEAMVRAMEARGIKLDVQDLSNVQTYAEEVAPPNEIDLLARDVDDYIRHLLEKRIVSVHYVDGNTVDQEFKSNPLKRVRFIGQEIFPRFFRDILGIRGAGQSFAPETQEDVMIFYNKDLLPTVNLHLFPHHRPVRELYRSGAEFRKL